jgi:hypothetical protein
MGENFNQIFFHIDMIPIEQQRTQLQFIYLFLNFLSFPPKAKRKKENLKVYCRVLHLKQQSFYRRDGDECYPLLCNTERTQVVL